MLILAIILSLFFLAIILSPFFIPTSQKRFLWMTCWDEPDDQLDFFIQKQAAKIQSSTSVRKLKTSLHLGFIEYFSLKALSHSDSKANDKKKDLR